MTEPLQILYRDDHLVCVQKLPGVFVHRTRLGPERDAMLQRVRDAVGKHVHPVHRLDRPTSGALLFAFERELLEPAQVALHEPLAVKAYLAFVRRVFEPEQQKIERPLTCRRTGVPKAARTDVRRIAVLAERNSLVEARIFTGRQHQIRRHLARSAHQLIGDSTYGRGGINNWFRETYGLPRLCLHAWRIELNHPVTGDRLRIHAPLPGDLLTFYRGLPGWNAELEALLQHPPPAPTKNPGIYRSGSDRGSETSAPSSGS
ncbi:MAG: pseudouridine synthase [Planctomycetota bacterium]|jgi:tRNA pseudouridine65 synthase